MYPTRDKLEEIFQLKYADAAGLGWQPQLNRRFGYFTPHDVYEATVDTLVTAQTTWMDVGGGGSVLVYNPRAARQIAERCRLLVGLDPSSNIHTNSFVHERVQSMLEDYQTDRQFDLITMCMVVEHVAAPEKFVSALARLTRPGGLVVVYTVNYWSPVTWLSKLTPHRVHEVLRKRLWGEDEKDTFPVVYKMNTRGTLRRLFGAAGFEEAGFSRLDDCRALSFTPLLARIELCTWKVLGALGLHYPENCLLGIYRRLPS